MTTHPTPQTSVVRIPEGAHWLECELTLPRDPQGLVLFAHRCGSRELQFDTRALTVLLEQQGFATLLTGLLTQEEDALDCRTAQLRFERFVPLPESGAACAYALVSFSS